MVAINVPRNTRELDDVAPATAGEGDALFWDTASGRWTPGGTVIVAAATVGRIPYWSGVSTLSDSGLRWDAANGRLGVGVDPAATFHLPPGATSSVPTAAPGDSGPTIASTEFVALAIAGGGGGGTPGGEPGQLQFNDAGAFAGTTGLTYGGAGVLLDLASLTATDTTLALHAVTATASIINVEVAAYIGTFTTAAPHGLVSGSVVVISGLTVDPTMNGTWVVHDAPTTTTFRISSAWADRPSTADVGTMEFSTQTDPLISAQGVNNATSVDIYAHPTSDKLAFSAAAPAGHAPVEVRHSGKYPTTGGPRTRYLMKGLTQAQDANLLLRIAVGPPGEDIVAIDMGLSFAATTSFAIWARGVKSIFCDNNGVPYVGQVRFNPTGAPQLQAGVINVADTNATTRLCAYPNQRALTIDMNPFQSSQYGVIIQHRDGAPIYGAIRNDGKLVFGAGVVSATAQLNVASRAVTDSPLQLDSIDGQTAPSLAGTAVSSTATRRPVGSLDLAWADSTDASRRGKATLSAANTNSTCPGITVQAASATGTGVDIILSGVREAADDAAAAALTPPVPVNGLYRTGSFIKIREA